MVWPVESTAGTDICLSLDLYIRLVDTVALIALFEMGPTALVLENKTRRTAGRSSCRS